MAYNETNRLKHYQFIIKIYMQVKDEDTPDTFIVRKIFPRYGIYISYRKWMEIKSMKPSELSVCK